MMRNKQIKKEDNCMFFDVVRYSVKPFLLGTVMGSILYFSLWLCEYMFYKKQVNDLNDLQQKYITQIMSAN